MQASDVRVLVGCEYSGRVRDSFRELGFDAWSCDLLPSDTMSPYHIQGDVIDVIYNEHWDIGIFHPPCTYMCNSGVSWLYRDPKSYVDGMYVNKDRWEKMKSATKFFNRLYGSGVEHIAIENPIMHGYAKRLIGAEPTQIVQPWMFGHLEKKATCLWLKGLPTLIPTSNLKAETDALPKREQQRLHYLPPSKDRWKIRSTTFEGIAKAMANQWGKYVLNEKIEF